MRSSIDALIRDIGEIRAMSSAIAPINEMLASSGDPNLRAYVSIRRRFDYSALIVAIYASYEQFVEDMLASYVALLSKTNGYMSLPQKLIEKHLQRTGHILSRGAIDQSRYPGVTAQQLIDNLYQCISGTSPYKLNPAAVTAHDRNLRLEELGELLRLVGISTEAIAKAPALIDWHYNNSVLTGPRPSNVPSNVLSGRLKDLVERRNDVAHRGGNPVNLLGYEELNLRVEFILALCTAISTVFVEKYLREQHVGKAHCERLKVVDGPFLRKMVQVIDPPNMRIRVGQPVFALSPSFLVRYGRIVNITVGGAVLPAVDPGGAVPIGIELDFPAPKSAQIYRLSVEDEGVWNDESM